MTTSDRHIRPARRQNTDTPTGPEVIEGQGTATPHLRVVHRSYGPVSPTNASKRDDQLLGASPTGAGEATWAGLFRVGAAAAIAVLVLIPVQVAVWIAWPPPTTVEGFFALFQSNWLLGLLGLDLLYLLTVVLMVPVLLALAAALWRVSASVVAVALALGLVAIAAYFPSNPAFEMLSLSGRYAEATTETQRLVFLAAGEAMLATYTGTAFDVYYVVNGLALLILSIVMLRSAVFGRATAYAGIVSGILFLVPSTAGMVGAIFSLVSLVPWTVFAVLIARTFLQLGWGAANPDALEAHGR
jgi:hypothetical protein